MFLTTEKPPENVLSSNAQVISSFGYLIKDEKSLCFQHPAKLTGLSRKREKHTVDVYRYKTVESIGNSFVTFTKGISYRF